MLSSSVTDPEFIRLRNELMDLAEVTNKGFTSTPSQKKRAREIIMELAKFNPTAEPASAYYDTSYKDSDKDAATATAASLAGKWDLIYTDAPDITSLDTSRNPFATAKLGRIGQHCLPQSGIIKNVIEWKKPDWANQLFLPFAGDADARILQKVITKATASPDRPTKVQLELAGIELVAPPLPGTSGNNGSSSSGSNNNNQSNTNDKSGKKLALQEAIETEGLAMGILRNNPLELRGPLTAPFGQFEILYLDENMRITRTGQNYVAVNVRSKDEWF